MPYDPKSASTPAAVMMFETENGGLDMNPKLGRRDYNDNETLRRTGKTPVLKRNFGFLPILGFNTLVLSTWMGSFPILGITLTNGGPAGTIYSFIIVWFGNLATFTSLAELASMAPTAGGQYHWVSVLASKNSQKGLSYLTGWLTMTGWQACVASSAYVTAMLIEGFIQLVSPSYTTELWHGTLFTYAALVVAIFATTFSGKILPRIESMIFIVYIVGFFAVLVPLVYLAPHGRAEFVFTTFFNRGRWPSKGLSFFVGISGNAFAFLGADSVYHMSEEIHNAAVVVPRSMVWSLTLNGVVGLSMFIALLFCAGDLNEALNSKYVYPFIEILLQALNSRGGSAVLVAIMIVVDFGLLIGVVASASRMLWSFSRDRGVPFWRHISKVNKRTSIPITSIATTASFTFLITLISIGSPVAFNDVVSLTVSALYASYLMACSLLLSRRLKGTIKPLPSVIPSSSEVNKHSKEAPAPISNLPGDAGNLTWGPWRVREPLGTVINIFACAYLTIVFFFSFWPPATPVSPKTMNYSCLVFGFVGIVSAVYYIVKARKVYTGPVVDIVVDR